MEVQIIYKNILMSNNEINYCLYSGSLGWVDGKGFDALYPTDLPETWRLAYYSTQFRCVYLPLDIWTKLTDSERSALPGEVPSGFRFVLESTGENGCENINKIKELSDKYIAEYEVEVCWLEPEISIRELAGIMRDAVNAGRPLYLISREADWALLRRINDLIELLGG